MNIVVLLTLNPFYNNSASSNRFRGLLEGLSNLGVKVAILITGGYQSDAEHKTFMRTGKINGIQYLYLYRITNKTIWHSRINTYFLSSLVSLIIKFRFRRYMENKEKSILWVGSDINQYIALVGFKDLHKHLLFAERSEFPDIHNHNQNTVNIFQKQKADRVEEYFKKFILPELDGMALMTKTLFNYYLSKVKPGTKLIHLPMTVDMERFDLNKKYLLPDGLKQPFIAFIGAMNNMKDGVNILIDAFAKIENEFPDLNLHLYGFWHYDSPGHQKQIKDLNLQHRIFCNGTVSREEIPNIIMNAELLVLPRPDSHQAQGGFPTKLGEYLATARPVCATTVGEIPDYLTDLESVYFALPGSIDSLAAAMRNALNNQEKARQVGANGRKVAEVHFNCDVQAKKLYNYFKALYENNSFCDQD